MPLTLPKLSSLSPANAFTVGKQLLTVVAFRPGAQTTYQFYEEIDAWLGPWGPNGYPIGYGRKYNIAFTTDPILNSGRFPVARNWIRPFCNAIELFKVEQ